MPSYRDWAAMVALGLSASVGTSWVYSADALTRVPKAATPAATTPASSDPKVFDLEVIRERYPDRTVKVERHASQDSNLNYVNHGPWTMWDPAGNMMAKGEYWQGKRHGEWKRWHLDSEATHPENLPGAGGAKNDPLSGEEFKEFKRPLTSTATFVEDKLVGLWSVVDADGKAVFSVELDRDVPQGKTSIYYPNGTKRREIDFKQGVVHGEWLEFDASGNPTRKDHYIDGRREAEASTKFDSGEKSSEGTYLYAKEIVKVDLNWWTGGMKLAVTGTEGKTIKQGKWEYWYEDGGKRCEAEYVDDKPIGRHTWWYRNGQKESEGEFVDGLAQGTWMYWHDNGQKAAQGDYFNGNKVGRWVRWGDDGKVVENKEHSVPDARMIQQAQQMQGNPPPQMIPYNGLQPTPVNGVQQPTSVESSGLQPIPETVTPVQGLQPQPNVPYVMQGQPVPQYVQPQRSASKNKGLFWKR